jgi:hypothetical protein
VWVTSVAGCIGESLKATCFGKRFGRIFLDDNALQDFNATGVGQKS